MWWKRLMATTGFLCSSQFVPVWYRERDARQWVRAAWVKEYGFLKGKEDAPPPCVWLGRGCLADVCKCVYCEVSCCCHEMASSSMFTCKWCAADWQAAEYVANMCRKRCHVRKAKENKVCAYCARNVYVLRVNVLCILRSPRPGPFYTRSVIEHPEPYNPFPIHPAGTSLIWVKYTFEFPFAFSCSGTVLMIPVTPGAHSPSLRSDWDHPEVFSGVYHYHVARAVVKVRKRI